MALADPTYLWSLYQAPCFLCPIFSFHPHVHLPCMCCVWQHVRGGDVPLLCHYGEHCGSCVFFSDFQ